MDSTPKLRQELFLLRDILAHCVVVCLPFSMILSYPVFHGISRLRGRSSQLVGSLLPKSARAKPVSNFPNFKAIDGYVDRNSPAFLSV